MKNLFLSARIIAWFCLVPFLASLSATQAMDQSSADTLATSILAATGRHCALVSVPHCGSGELVLSLWNKVGESHALVDGFESNPTLLASAQQNANALGLLGRNVYLRSGTLSTAAYSMPYADNLVDLVVVTNLQDSDLSSIAYAEMERVLCISGKAWIGRAASETGGTLTTGSLNAWISGTHALSTATVVSDATGMWAVITKINRLPNTYEGGGGFTNAGNRFFPDYVATWPTLPQFAVKPYGRINSNGALKIMPYGMLDKICVGGGRMYGFDGVPYSGNNTLCALRAQNGILLWQRPGLDMTIAGDIQPFSKGVVYGNQIIDGETGVTTGTIPIPSNWTGGVAYLIDNNTATNDILYTVGRGSNKINTLIAYDLINKTPLYTVSNFTDNNFISTWYTGNVMDYQLQVVLAGGKLYAATTGTTLYCYNTADGSKKWGPVTAPEASQFLEASPNGVLMQAGVTGTVNYYFFGSADGSLKWGPKAVSSPHEYCDISTIPSLNSGREAICIQQNGSAIDLLTGTNCGTVGWYPGGQCAPGASMMPAGFNSRRNGITYSMPLRANTNTDDPWASDCTDSPMAAGGLMIVKPKYSCSCFSFFRGSTGQGPLGSFNPEQIAVQSERLQQGSAYGNINMQVTADSLDWATHRANNNRGAYVPVQIPTDKLVQLWKYTNPTPNTFNYSLSNSDDFFTYHDVTPPVSAGSYLNGSCYTFVAGSDGIVKCLDNSTGNLVWSYATGSWIFATPTVANGCVYVGSGDGYVYCIEAKTGTLVWKFRAAPAERRFNYYGHLISTWPVLTGVLAHSNGNLYFAAGLMGQYGVQVYALNGTTGAIVWQNTSAGTCLDNRPGLARVGHWPGGYMVTCGNNLLVKEAHHAYAKSAQRIDIYDLQTGAISPADSTFGVSQNDGAFYHTGRQIGIMGNYVFGWGEDIQTEMEFEQYCGATSISKMDALGNPVRPFILIRTPDNINAIAWDNAEAFRETIKYKLSGTNSFTQFLDSGVANPPPTSADPTKYSTSNFTAKWPTGTTTGWTPAPVSASNRAQALTSNCLVQLSGSGDICVMDRGNGTQYFHVNTGGETYLQALAVDRSGKIIAVNRTGDVVCFATPDPVIVTQPSDVIGVENGQSATFGVEAAGPNLAYRWQFNGVAIAGATLATYSVPSVSDSNVGVYSCVVTNTTGTATTDSAMLATAVTADITSPTDGSTFAQPADSQPASITLSATASSLHGTVTKVEFYDGATLLGQSGTAPYTFKWTGAMPGSHSVTCKAYDTLGKTGVSSPVNITVVALVVHYKMDETSGTVAHDTSGYNNNGALASYYGAASYPVWMPQGLFNGSLQFNDCSKSQSVTLGPVSQLSGSSFTLGYWINYSIYGSGTTYSSPSFTFKGTYNSSLAQTGWGGNWPTILWYTTAGTKINYNSALTSHVYTTGSWYHYALVVTPGKADWYINGSLYYSFLPPGGQSMATNYQTFGIGGANPAAGRSLMGCVDDVKIYNGTLSSADIYAMYATNIPYKQPPAVSLTSPTDGQIVTATNSLTLAALTSGSHFPMSVNYYANGALIGTGTAAPNYNFTWNGVARGTYAVTGTVTDGLGQVASSNTAIVTFSYVTAPVLNIQGGTYLNAQNVTVTCSDTSAVIYYTTDGSDPTTSGTVIASGSSIPITKTTILKVETFKNGFQPSEVQTVIYRIGPVLTAGSYHSFALFQGAPLWAWGNNANGQLGDNTTTNRYSPVCVGNLNNLVSVSPGGWNSVLAVDAVGAVWAWGGNSDGQLGIGNTTEQHLPVKLSGISNALSVSAGGYHGLAMKWDGTVWAWGYNYYGQLGINGTSANKTSPVQVLVAGSTVLTNVTAVAGGYYHSLALKSDGTVWSWGYNYCGALGYSTGTATIGTVAAPVTGLTGSVTAIAAGAYFSLALKSDGTVWAWGYNYSGQLGNGTTTNSTTPVQVSGLTNVTAISVSSGGAHVLALKSDGTVWGWGTNNNYQLGDGTTTKHTTPFQITGLSNMIAVAAGENYSLALGNDGALWAWGYNTYGNLGNSGTATVTTPAASISSSNAYVVFTTGMQTVSESAPPFPVIPQLFCSSTTSVTVPVSISGSAVKGTDYTISGSSVTIPVGQTSGSFTISPINDTQYKGSRNIILTMGTVVGATKGIITSNTTTITDEDPMPSVNFATGTLTATEASGTLQIPIQLSAPAGVNVTIPFGLSGSALGGGTDYLISVSSGTITASNTTTNIDVTLMHRSGYQGDRTLTLTMGTPTNATIGSFGVETITITDVDPKPISILTPVANQSVQWGQAATFSVAVDGSNPAYQWCKNGTPISGATNASYTTPATVVTDNGAVFSVVASNVVNSATSSGTLSVQCYPIPAISIRNPISGTTIPGAPANLTIQVEIQSPGVSCIQFYEGSTLLGQTSGSSSFTWNNVPAGQYAITAVITDTQGQTTTSAPIYITVSNPAAYDDWVIAHGLVGSQALENSSPADDNISNLIKYALGLDPGTVCTRPTDGTNPGLPLLGNDGANLTLTFQQDTANCDITYTVEASSDMVNWSPSNVTLTVTGSNGTVNTVKATIPKGSHSREFLRLKVTK